MISVSLDKFSINRFWEKTPTPLKYILVFVLFLTVSYFLISKNAKDNSIKEIEAMKTGINATYELIGNFEDFRREQDSYNKEILTYLNNLHSLVQELNLNTNRKLDIILSAGGKNANQVIEKIMLLNESFEKLQKAYETNIEAPNLKDDKIKDISPNIIIRKINDTVLKK
jgi:hypothetical protein